MSVESFVTAASVGEAVAALALGARPVAGGTDLVVLARQGRRPLPQSLVAIHRVPELRGLAVERGVLRAGSLTTHAELAADATVRERLTAIADASAIVGSHATRANGTIGGNLMNASPAMDTGGPLVCLGATVALASPGGTRDVEVADLLAGPGETTAAPDELLTVVSIPLPASGTGSCYVRLEYRRAMEIAIVGATAVVTLAAGEIVDARVAITALAPKIRRIVDAEELLIGTNGDRVAAASAAAAAAEASSPISDVRGSADYRRAMAEVVVRRAIVGAVTRATGGTVPVPASLALHGAS